MPWQCCGLSEWLLGRAGAQPSYNTGACRTECAQKCDLDVADAKEFVLHRFPPAKFPTERAFPYGEALTIPPSSATRNTLCVGRRNTSSESALAPPVRPKGVFSKQTPDGTRRMTFPPRRWQVRRCDAIAPLRVFRAALPGESRLHGQQPTLACAPHDAQQGLHAGHFFQLLGDIPLQEILGRVIGLLNRQIH